MSLVQAQDRGAQARGTVMGRGGVGRVICKFERSSFIRANAQCFKTLI